MSERFCVNCRHYSLPAPDADPVCLRSQKPATIVSLALGEWLVTGRGKRPFASPHWRCAVEREDSSQESCGLEGRFYIERGAA